MGLYLCVFAGENDDSEVEGVDVGGYDDFGAFRDTVAETLEGGRRGSRFPTLMLRHDSDGVWTLPEVAELVRELTTIDREFRDCSPRELLPGWPSELGRELGLRPRNLTESFIDLDGRPLVLRLRLLAALAMQWRQPIWFQ